jgi:hypothetical protein
MQHHDPTKQNNTQQNKTQNKTPPLCLPPSLLCLQVARECQPLIDVCEFVTADSIESFVLSYTALLTSAPSITPTLLANLINARATSDKNMTKADAREVLEHCREVFVDRQARSGVDDGAHSAAQSAAAAASAAAQAKGAKAPTAKEAAFKAGALGSCGRLCSGGSGMQPGVSRPPGCSNQVCRCLTRTPLCAAAPCSGECGSQAQRCRGADLTLQACRDIGPAPCPPALSASTPRD